MPLKIKNFFIRNHEAGQNTLEYILLFAGVVALFVVVAGKSGIMTKQSDQALDSAVKGVACMAVSECFDPKGCPTVCGNGCCETGETPASCSSDCSCTTDADCDDGLFCNGAETCGTGFNCQGGTAPAVDDGVACTIDACVEGSGVVHTPDNTVCDDGIACTGLETCSPSGGCQPGGEVCASCPAPGGGTVPHLGSGIFCQSATVPYGSSCSCETRLCYDGSLTGTYTASSCSVLPPADCPAPGGGTIANGASRTYYQTSGVPCGGTCNWQVRLCTNGSLSGSYTNTGCSALPCASCFNACNSGLTLLHGQTRVCYQSSSVACGGSCSSIAQPRTCNNGVLSGSYANAACTVGACCGNGACDNGETCSTCSTDCGACGGTWVFSSQVCNPTSCTSRCLCSGATSCPASDPSGISCSPIGANCGTGIRTACSGGCLENQYTCQ